MRVEKRPRGGCVMMGWLRDGNFRDLIPGIRDFYFRDIPGFFISWIGIFQITKFRFSFFLKEFTLKAIDHKLIRLWSFKHRSPPTSKILWHQELCQFVSNALSCQTIRRNSQSTNSFSSVKPFLLKSQKSKFKHARIFQKQKKARKKYEKNNFCINFTRYFSHMD